MATKHAILFIAVIIGVIGIVTGVVVLDTDRASQLQSILPGVSNDDLTNQDNQDNNVMSEKTPSSINNSTSGLFGNNTSVIPEQAYDPYPYP